MDAFPYALTVQRIDGSEATLEPYRDHVLLIVNTASRCGFTPQYAGLERLHRELAPRRFAVLGFPCNQFMNQEPDGEAQIATFCSTRYDVTFPLFARINVNGDAAHPLFRHLKRAAPGVLGSEAVKWNFTKFLVDRTGRVVGRFAPTDDPEGIAPKVRALVDA